MLKYFPVFLIVFLAACTSKYDDGSVADSDVFSSSIIDEDIFKNAKNKTVEGTKSTGKSNKKSGSLSTVNLNSKTEFIVRSLEKQERSWRNTPYRFGGNSRKGIDCSAFVMRTFKDHFNLSVPRTTFEQSKIGKVINKSELRPGDLVFFKTGKNARHVGIYYKDNRFLHASTSKGIIFSSLDNSYWKSKYWKAIRMNGI